MHDTDAGLVVYALDLARVSAFYAAVARLTVASSEPDHVVLQRGGFQLVVVKVPPQVAAGLEVSDPPERRADTAVKPVLTVASIEAARAEAARLGGVVDGPEHEWDFQGRRVCDGHDPEGNVLQLREPTRERAGGPAPALTLRPVTAEEYDGLRGPALAVFAADLARAEHRPLDDALRARAEGFYPATLAEALAEDGAHILRVVDGNGAAVGLLWLGRPAGSSTTGFVYDVVIDEAHRGRGLGRAAMLAAEDVFRAEGCDRIALNVFGWNGPADALYRSLGFDVDATQLSKPLVDPS